nr:glycosyltransferase [Tessaracoccus sp. MC1865]
MTVDNGVVGDSRVIKSARSAREAGFDVVVLGYGSVDPLVEGVDVRLFPAMPAGRRQSSGLRWALRTVAMDPGDVRAYRLRPRKTGVAGVVERFAVALRWRINKFAGYGPREWQRLYELAERSDAWARRLQIWEHLDPSVAGLNRGIVGPLIEFEPDIIHVHDYRTLPAAAAARRELNRRGRAVRVVYDAHEYVPGLLEIGEARLAAAQRIERKHIAIADAVVSVSDDLATRMQSDHKLPERPLVVVNAPGVPGRPLRGKGLRDRLGLDQTTPLLVYSGSVGHSRWLTHTVDILPSLPAAHMVLIVSHPTSNVIEALEERATSLGVLDRFHVTRYVRPECLVEFLSEATVGLVPLRHTENVQDSLPSKTYEYLAAGVPQAVSDQRVLGEFVRQTGVGEVFEADSADDMAAAVGRILADPQRYRSAITPGLQARFTWSSQVDPLLAVYDRLAATLKNPPRSDAGRDAAVEVETTPDAQIQPLGESPDGSVRLAIMPVNTDGQGVLWAQATARLDGVKAASFSTSDPNADHTGTGAVLPHGRRTDAGHMRDVIHQLSSDYTHVLLEAGWTPVEYTYLPLPVCQAVETLEEAGVLIGQVFHGAELRLPSRHASLYPSSRLAKLEAGASLEKRAFETIAVAEWLGLDQFTASLDLLDFLPNARWLPRVVSADSFAVPGAGTGAPTVVHLPSETSGYSSEIDQVLQELAADRGLRVLDRGSAPVRQLVQEADVVVDNIGVGGYGANAVLAMASSCAVIGQVGSSARSRIDDEIPIVEVADIASLREALARVVGDATYLSDLRSRSHTYARRWHDGQAAADVLAQFLGVRK